MWRSRGLARWAWASKVWPPGRQSGVARGRLSRRRGTRTRASARGDPGVRRAESFRTHSPDVHAAPGPDRSALCELTKLQTLAAVHPSPPLPGGEVRIAMTLRPLTLGVVTEVRLARIGYSSR